MKSPISSRPGELSCHSNTFTRQKIYRPAVNDSSEPPTSQGSGPGLRCPVCDQPVNLEQKFCGHCGAALVKSCAVCGAENPLVHRFCSVCGAPFAQETSPSRALEGGREAPFHRDERRWATVMFADLAGFTTLAERMDAEDIKALAEESARRISQVVHSHGGTVLRVIGDEVLAVFGAPVAHEDDSERAVRSGLAIRDLNLSAGPEEPVKVHVGINTGEVIAGVVDPRGVHDYNVHGDAVNTAARLRDAAPAGSVYVGEDTYQETQAVLHYRPVSPFVAKGKDRPVAAWEALSVISPPRERPFGTGAFIGRDEELERLENMWSRVDRQSQPHLVTILGEPGIGKSRLVAEFERRLPAEVVRLHGRCLPYGDALGYWSLAMMLKEAAGISPDDEAATARAKLDSQVRQVMDEGENPAEVSRHLALMTGLDSPSEQGVHPPDQRVLHNSVRRYLEAFSRRRPACLICDDIHWADETLLDLIEFVAARARDVPLLILTQARPELLEKRATWGKGVRSFTSLVLEPLGEGQEQELVVALLSEHGLPADLADKVRRSAAGNPLFAEELVAMIAEGGETRRVPSLLKVLIATRLDSLPAGLRRTIQFAAVFGRNFWEAGVSAMSGDDGRYLAADLEALELKDLLRRLPHSQLREQREFSFKHDLIRDVAYEMLTKTERRRLHGLAAGWLDRSVGEQREAYLDHLAHHARQAGQQQLALEYLGKAVERDRRAGAYRHAAGLLSQAIEIAEVLERQDLVMDRLSQRARAYLVVGMWPEASQDFTRLLETTPAEKIEERAALHLDLAECYTGMLQASEIRRHAERALELADMAGRDDLAAAALANMSVVSSSQGDLHTSIDLYRRSLQRSHGRPSGYTSAHAFQVMVHYWLGSFDQALAQAERIQEQVKDDIAAQLELHGNLGAALTALARYEEAEKLFSEGIHKASDYEVWPYLARTKSIAAGYRLDLFDYAGHATLAEEARQLADENKFMSTYVSSSIDLLFNFTRTGEVGKAQQLIPEVKEAIEQASGFHAWLWRLRFSQLQAEMALARGDGEGALRLARETISQSQERGRVKYQVLGLQAQARALASLGHAPEANRSARQAVELARSGEDPARLLQAALTALELQEDEGLARQAHAAARKIQLALPEGELRQAFEQAAPVQQLLDWFPE
jgi:predicted ATPase/class 3 adenylate cyclase